MATQRGTHLTCWRGIRMERAQEDVYSSILVERAGPVTIGCRSRCTAPSISRPPAQLSKAERSRFPFSLLIQTLSSPASYTTKCKMSAKETNYQSSPLAAAPLPRSPYTHIFTNAQTYAHTLYQKQRKSQDTVSHHLTLSPNLFN